MNYRHEIKFLVSSADLEYLHTRIIHLTQPDIHQSNNGYDITSLYFDTPSLKCFHETLNGYDLRHKYRIRIYNHQDSIIKLERKSKIHSMTAKNTVPLTRQESDDLLRGTIPYLHASDSSTKKQLLAEMKLFCMQPKCIVQYHREAFVYRTGNVRITFDRNITGTSRIQDFFCSAFHTYPVLRKNVHILEVKYDQLLPNFIANALDIESMQRTSFSKYMHVMQTQKKMEVFP